MKPKFWNWPDDADFGERTLILNGTITDDARLEDSVTPRRFRAELSKCSGDVIVWINSPGGGVLAAAQICNMLTEYLGNVRVRIDGLAASAATVVAMAGNVVEISPVGCMFVHNPEATSIGNAGDHRLTIEILSEIKECIINTYEIKTGRNRKELSGLMDNTSRICAQKAVNLGFADKINIAATKPAASRIEEVGALTFGDAIFDRIILDAYKFHVAVKITEELLYDNAFKLENYIIDQFGKVLSNVEENAFLNGDGSHKPTGLLTTAQVGVTTSGNTISADELIEPMYKLKRPYRKSAAFIVNDRMSAVIRTLKDRNKAYMWQPSYRMGEPDRLLGYSVYTTPYIPTIKAGKAAVAFGDCSCYNIGDRQRLIRDNLCGEIS